MKTIFHPHRKSLTSPVYVHVFLEGSKKAYEYVNYTSREQRDFVEKGSYYRTLYRINVYPLKAQQVVK